MFCISQIYTEEGWIFIEENSYRLLIDTILEKQEEVERQQVSDLLCFGLLECVVLFHLLLLISFSFH